MRIYLFAAVLLLTTPALAQTGSETVSQWAQQTIPAILDIVPRDFDAQKERNRALFTKKGHDEFYKAMERARMRESLKSSGLVAKVRKMCVTNVKPPTEKDKFWIVESEILYEFSDSTRTRTDMQKVTAIIEDSGKDGATQLALAQYIAVPVSKYDFKCTDNTPDPHAARKDEIRNQIRALEDELRALGGDPQTDFLR